jgi:hypothetical protein
MHSNLKRLEEAAVLAAGLGVHAHTLIAHRRASLPPDSASELMYKMPNPRIRRGGSSTFSGATRLPAAPT